MRANTKKWDRQHLINIGLSQKQIDRIFDESARNISQNLMYLDDYNPDDPFTFDDYPVLKRQSNKVFNTFNNKLQTVVVGGIISAWKLSNDKNNSMCNGVLKWYKYEMSEDEKQKYYNNNDKVRDAFIKRKRGGLNISDRVWNYTEQIKKEMELAIDLGLRDGLSADEMARSLMKYLREPERLYRRVRDVHGQLHLSQAAKDYHPGRGVYRSSYRNALRLASNEINMAYRTADHERWQQLDFVVGFNVKRSGRIYDCPVCESLTGKYPKDFLFTGWHPQCRCYAVTILNTADEFWNDAKESVNTVTDVPDGFNKWVEENADRIRMAEQQGTLPYFLKDNEKYYK